MKSKGSYHSGFTLVELMASMAVGMIVLLVAVGMLRTTGDGYERLGGGVNAEREARALVNQLLTDFSSATYHKDMVMKEGSESWPLDQIGFLALQPEDAQLTENHIGDLCAIRYYTKDEKIGGKTVRCLMRGVTESKDTFQGLKNGMVLSLFQEPVASGTDSNTDEAIAFGVVSFEARPKIRDNNGALTDWKTSDGAPDAVVLRLVLARRELAAKLNSPSEWSGKGSVASSQMGNPADALRNKNFQVYETTVRFGHHEPKS